MYNIQSMNHTQISILCSYPTLRSKAYNKFAISWIYFNSLTNPATNWNIQLERPSDELLPPQRSVQTCSQRLTNSNHKVRKMTHVQHIWLNSTSRRWISVKVSHDWPRTHREDQVTLPLCITRLPHRYSHPYHCPSLWCNPVGYLGD